MSTQLKQSTQLTQEMHTAQSATSAKQRQTTCESRSTKCQEPNPIVGQALFDWLPVACEMQFRSWELDYWRRDSLFTPDRVALA
jgi:hypothetical protein